MICFRKYVKELLLVGLSLEYQTSKSKCAFSLRTSSQVLVSYHQLYCSVVKEPDILHEVHAGSLAAGIHRLCEGAASLQ